MRVLLMLVALSGYAVAAQADANRSQIERGQYLARAADCAACHTAKGGTPYAGGHPLETPFGIVYGTNITPDEDYGIGNYSADDFHHVLTQGELPDGTQLYPAMPYTDYHAITRADSDAMYAYFMSLKPVHVQGPQTDLAWPFSMRWTLNAWNWMFAPEADAGAADSHSEHGDDTDRVAQRGRYLVDTLGHCGACHTPRNVAGAVKDEQHLQGAVIGGYLAPSLDAGAMAARGWDRAALKTFLKKGMSAQGSMYSEMYPVFEHSTRYLTDDDLSAMTQYLMGENPPSPAPAKTSGSGPDTVGRQLYLDSCAGCHGADGQGVPQAASAMTGNTTLRLESPRNLVKVIHDGIVAREFAEFERVQAMPGFADTLDDGQIATLATWLRRQWGGQQDAVEPATVGELTGVD